MYEEFAFFHRNGAMELLKNYIDNMTSGSSTLFGFTNHNGQWKKLLANSKHTEVYEALMFAVENFFQLQGVICARIGKGVANLPAIQKSGGSLTMYWMNKREWDHHYLNSEQTSINFKQLIGENYPNARFIQLVYTDEVEFPVNEVSSSSTSEQTPIN